MSFFQPPFLIIPILQAIIVFTAGMVLFVGSKSKEKTAFQKVLHFASSFVLLHSMYLIGLELLFAKENWTARLAPFSLAYGPLIYFAIHTLNNRSLSNRIILVHFIPVIAYFIFYLLLLFHLVEPTAGTIQVLRKHLVIVNPLLFSAYALWIVFEAQGTRVLPSRETITKIVFIRILLLFITMFTIAFAFFRHGNNIQADFIFKLLINICTLTVLLIMLNYITNKLARVNVLKHVDKISRDKRQAGLSRYARSALTGLQLARYEELLNKGMRDNKWFLDRKLSLSSLATKLRIPNHHLTQVLSMQVEQSFYDFINGLRVKHACILLNGENTKLNAEVIAEQSGFNSKVSFNRHFKKVTGHTPSAYRSNKEKA